MPTLIEVPLDASSEVSSFEDGETVLNDSTRLVDETVVVDASILHSQRAVDDTALDNNGTRLDVESTVDNDGTRLDVDSAVDNDETRLDDETILNDDSQLKSVPSPREDVGFADWKKQEAAVSTTGPQEEQYRRHHERYVSRIIADIQHRHPDKLRDYRSMSRSEQEKEKRRIMALLGRLGISTDTVLCCSAQSDTYARVALAETSSDSSATRLDLDQSSLTAESLHRSSFGDGAQDQDTTARPFSQREHDTDMAESDQSKALYSPEQEIDDLAARIDQSMALLSQTSIISTSSREKQAPNVDDSPSSSVELVRKSKSVPPSPPHHLYESPTITTSRSKRCASASGKRGTDLSRMRLDDDSFVSFDASIARASEMISSPSQLQCSSVKSPESLLFSASQSPICDHNSSWDEASIKSQPKRHHSDDRSMNDTIHSPDCTINHRRRVRWNENSFLREIPANVRLKDDVPFRMMPLRVGQPSRRGGGKSGRRRRVSLVSMPDPLSGYQGTLRKKMNAAYSWMRDQDSSLEGDCVAGCMLFSMSAKQIIDVTLKLIVKVPSQHTTKDMINDVVNGGTLIVARSKEDLEEWRSSLREGTAYSVLNHATMTVEERKRTSTGNRCAGYDIVVTTFDAIKSRDIATPLDNEGHVVRDKIGFQDGWYSSRSSGSEAPDRCEQLSVLHQIHWRRVIFVDTLGRKSYLAKQGTSRAVAAVALSGSSRFVFFRQSDDDKTSPLDALAKSDRRAFRSVATVLRLGEEQAEGGVLSNVMFDLNHVATRGT